MGSTAVMPRQKQTAEFAAEPRPWHMMSRRRQYDTIDDYLEGRDLPEAAAELIEQKFLQTRHKRAEPVTMFDAWWRD